MKKKYQSPTIQLFPLASQLSFCNYAVSDYKDGGSTTVGASATKGEAGYEE